MRIYIERHDGTCGNCELFVQAWSGSGVNCTFVAVFPGGTPSAGADEFDAATGIYR
jgi:hypothetical protein